jgi:hypothetical protein
LIGKNVVSLTDEGACGFRRRREFEEFRRTAVPGTD